LRSKAKIIDYNGGRWMYNCSVEEILGKLKKDMFE
jgi:hypothetical protein